MQYRIYCEHFVRLLRMFGSLQTSNVYVQIFSNKYILRVYYTDDEYIQFVVEEQQFDVQVKEPITVILPSATVESLSKLPLKDTKSDLILCIYTDDGTEPSLSYQDISDMILSISTKGSSTPKYIFTYQDIQYKVEITDLYLNTPAEYISSDVKSLDKKILADIININDKCALNQNHELYLNIKQGLIVLNKDASIASYIDGQYILSDCEQTPEDLELIISKPKFVSNFLNEVKIDSDSIIGISSNIIHLNSYVSVGKKELFKYQLYLKFSSVTNRHQWSYLLDLKNEIQRGGKLIVLSEDKINKLVKVANEHDTESLLYIANTKALFADIVLRIFKPLIPKEKDDNFQGIEVSLYKDKLLVFNNDVFTVTTLNIKLSDIE